MNGKMAPMRVAFVQLSKKVNRFGGFGNSSYLCTPIENRTVKQR